MGNKKLIVMSSIPDSAIENTNRPLAYLDQSFKVDEEYKQKLKENEVRWPNKQYLIVPRAHGKKAVIDELKKLWRKKDMNDKDLMKKLSTITNEEIEQEAKELINDGIPKELIKPLWEDEMLKEQIANTTDEDIEKFCESLGVTDSWHIEINAKPAERKKWLMTIDKEHLVDMVFDLESRNEFLLHNLSEVEKMYNKLKEEVENG